MVLCLSLTPAIEKSVKSKRKIILSNRLTFYSNFNGTPSGSPIILPSFILIFPFIIVATGVPLKFE